jgi:hypothetical protein
MKTIALAMFVAASSIFMSCSKSDDIKPTKATLSEAEIPAEIKSYIAAHFPSNIISTAVKDSDGNIITYEINLSGNVEMEFNHAYQIMDINATEQLPNSVIPQAILDYVAANYPDNYITDWELEDNHQEVELNNGVELEFDMNGVFIRIDND